MASKFSRAALIASLAVGASGLVAVPAEAANSLSTANYYVNNPTVTGAGSITPESAMVTAAVDTGGSPESLIPVTSAGLAWSPGVTITSEKWAGAADTLSGNYAPIDGIPDSGSDSNVSVTITDPALGANSGKPIAVSNSGADNYSDVTFEYDPVSDYDAVDNQPGPSTEFARDIQVPTKPGISGVRTTIGAFGQAAQANTGNDPLKPGTKYYYWIVQQAGATDQASYLDVAAWVANTSNGQPANNSYKCYPNAAIAQDPALAALTAPGATVTYGGTTIQADQGTCIYYYGNTGGALYYQSPNGTFTTPKLGDVKIAAKATVKGSNATVALTNASAYKASGTLDLTVGGKLAGTAKFSLAADGKGTAKLVLNAKGKTALSKKQAVKVAPVSQTATITSVSNWDQPLVGKSIKL